MTKKLAPLCLLLSIAILFLASGREVAADAPHRTYFVSLVPKYSVTNFYNRLATSDAHVVLTSEEVPNAETSIEVNVREDEELLLVEPRNRRPESVENALSTVGPYAVVKIPNWGGAKHFHIGDQFNYVEIAERKETVHSLPTLPRGQLESLEFKSSGLALAELSSSFSDFVFPELDEDFLKQKISELSGAVPTTIDGQQVTISERGSKEGRKLARAWLRQEYEALGYVTSEHTYSTGSNFIAERTGADPSRHLMVTAHLDSVRNAGADDDGAGTITVLAIAHALKDLPIAYNLRVVGFDEEELGLVGSAAYAKSLASNNGFEGLIGVINIEMTAYDRDGDFGYHVIDCNENTSSELTAIIDQKVSELGLPLKKVAACTNRSDHASFWRHNQPAIVISQNFFGGDSNPCYHMPCDRVDILNFEYMAQVTRGIGAGVAAILVK